jgi:hypothetical protein
VLSREPSSLWPPSPQRKSPAPRRLTQMPHSPELDRSNDGQDHTVLPYARPAISPQYSQPCRPSRKLTDETKPSSAARRNEALGSRRAIRPAHTSRTRTLPRPPQARLANMTTTRSPLKDEPGWPTHTPFPNFGKAEYFHQCGLTPVRVGLSRCFARRRSPPARRDAGDEPKGLVSACGRPGAACDNPSPPRT